MLRLILSALTIFFFINVSTAAETAGLLNRHATVVSENDNELIISFSIPEAEVGTVSLDGSDYCSFQMPDEGIVGVQGLPNLPAVTRTVIVPPRAGIHLDVLNISQRTADFHLPPPIYVDELASEGSFEQRSTMEYSSRELFPPEPVVLGDPQIFRGIRVVPVTVYPYQYNPVDGKYTYNEEIEISISFTQNDPNALNPVQNPERANLTRDSYRFLRALTLNPPRRDDDGATLPRGGYLIVVGTGLEDAEEEVQKFADWKRACGHYVEVVYGESSYSTIRDDYVIPAYNEWDPPLEYLCLVGSWGNPNPAYNDNGDLRYGLIEGNDHIAEVAVCRLAAGLANQTFASVASIALMRCLGYQATPYIEETDWFGHAGAVEESVSNYSPSVEYTVRWISETERRVGFDDVGTFFFAGGAGDGIYGGSRINEWMRDGLNIVFVRGRGTGVCFVNDPPVFPMYFFASGHGESTMHQQWVQGTLNRLQGPSAVCCTWHNPPTQPNNIMIGGMARGLLVDRMSLGWSRAYAQLMLDYSGFGSFESYYQLFTLLGDPGQLTWIGEPKTLEVDHPEYISPGTSRLTVTVNDPEMEVSVPGALVTLTQPDILLSWSITDNNGECVFTLDPDNEDDIVVTVTGDQLLPYQAVISYEQAERFANARITDVLDDEDGNDDGILNPGETVQLVLAARNYGEVLINVNGRVRSRSPWVAVADSLIDFGNIVAGDENAGNRTIELTLASTAPEGCDLKLYIELSSGQHHWISNLPVDVVGSRLVLDEIVSGYAVAPGLFDLDLSILNLGSARSPTMIATVESGSWEIGVIDPESELDQIAANRTGDFEVNPFRINCSGIGIPGVIVPMRLLLRAQEEDAPYIINFNLQVSEPQEGAPHAPDEYGYVCFDDTDDEWRQVPEYDWIEISLEDDDRDFDGTELDDDRLNDYAVEIDLPFTFRYYGEDWDVASICENGFMAFGPGLETLRQYENFPLDRSMNGVPGMIAPLWDDLRVQGNESGIYTYYIEEEGCFVVEWYQAQFSGDYDQFSFQILLWDREAQPTVAGDGVFQFQYKDNIEPYRGMTPGYFSVGICSPDCGTGINYSCENEYDISSAELQARRAILFTTSPRNPPCTLHGRVTDFETGLGIPNATVFTKHSYAGVTDEDGYWRIENAPAEIEFDVTAALLGYNDSTRYDFYVEQDESLEVNFELLHPEFTPSAMQLGWALEPDRVAELQLQIANTGNGPLDWSLERKLPGNADVQPWEYRSSYLVGEITGDSRLEGLVLVDSLFYISGAGYINDGDSSNRIWILDKESNLQDYYEQPGDSRYGMRDLAYDPEENLIWGSGDRVIYGFTPEGEVMRTFDGPFTSHQAVAWDPDREILWVSGIVSDNISGVRRDGEEVVTIPRFNFRIYGLAYWPDDPDHCPLYILHTVDDDEFLYKLNPDDPDTVFVANLRAPDGGRAGGAFATNKLDVYSWVLLALANNGENDRIDVWQIEGRRDWFKLYIDEAEAITGRIDATEAQDFRLVLNSDGLPRVPFEGMLVFNHNAGNGRTIIDVDLEVVGQWPPSQPDLLYPEDNAVVNLNDSSDVTFSWLSSIDPNDEDLISYIARFKSGTDSTAIALEDTALTINIPDLADNLGLPIQANWSLTWWINTLSGEDTVSSVERFNLEFLPNALVDKSENPLEFGIQSVYPSPFNSTASIQFEIDQPGAVTLNIYDMQGRQVNVLYSQSNAMPGSYSVVWNASDFPSGIYILRLKSVEKSEVQKVALIR